MADTTNSLFTKKASEKLRSPDDLDEYVRVTNPSIWIVLAACAALLLGLFAWGVFGTVETKVSATGTSVGDKTICFLTSDEASKVHVGDDAKVGGKPMEVESVSAVPLSSIEAREIVGSDFLTNTLVQSDWVYVVSFKGSDDARFEEGIPIPLTVTTERIAPISLIFKGDS